MLDIVNCFLWHFNAAALSSVPSNLGIDNIFLVTVLDIVSPMAFWCYVYMRMRVYRAQLSHLDIHIALA